MTTSVPTRTTGRLNPTQQQLDELDALLQRMLELPVHPLEEPEQAAFAEAVQEPPSAKEEGEQKKKEKTSSVLQPSTSVVAPSGTPPLLYTVVETASPRPLPPASGFEPQLPVRTPRLVPVTPPPKVPVVPSMGEDGETETWVPLRSTWKPSASTWPPLAESWHQANSGEERTPVANAADSLATRQLTLPGEAAKERNPATDAAGSPEIAPVPEAAGSSVPAEEQGLPVAELPRNPSAEDAPGVVPWPLLPLVWFNQGFDACLAPLGAPGRWLCGRGRIVLGFIGLACLAAAIAIAVNTGMGWSP